MRNDMLKVENESRLFRDSSSKAIINNDEDGYNNYVANRAKRKAMQEALQQHDNDIKNINQELSDIKNMLAILVANIQK